jgi:hypothetical protein
LWQLLIIFAQMPPPIEPAESSFDYPTTRQDLQRPIWWLMSAKLSPCWRSSRTLATNFGGYRLQTPSTAIEWIF